MKISSRTQRALLIAVGVGIVAYIVGFFIPKTYETHATLSFTQAGAGGGFFGSGSGLPSALGGGGGADATANIMPGLPINNIIVGTAINTGISILQADGCYRWVAKELDLPHRWSMSLRQATKTLKDNTEVKSDKNGQMSIRVHAPTSKETVEIANLMLKYLNTKSDVLTREINKPNLTFLQRNLSSARTDINRLKSQMSHVMRNSPYAGTQDVMKQWFDALSKFEDVQTQRQGIIAGMIQAETLTTKALQEGKQDPHKVNAYNTIPALKSLSSDILAARLDFERIRERYMPGSKEYKLSAQNKKIVENFADQLAKEEQGLLGKGLTAEQRIAKSNLADVDARLAELKKALTIFEEAVRKSPEQYGNVADIQAEFQTALQTKSMMQTGLELTKMAISRETPNFSVIDEPYEDEEPVAPSKWKIALAAFLLVLALQAAPVAAQKLKEQPE